MIDFGLSKHFDLGQKHTEMVGTPYTVAPEIIRGVYAESCDLWSIGVITYLLLSGETPFGGLDGENMLLVRQNIMRAQLTFQPPDVWAGISKDGRAFVQKLLQADSAKRPTAKQAQKDEWIQVWAKKVRQSASLLVVSCSEFMVSPTILKQDVSKGDTLNAKTVSALMAFKESSDMQKILSEVLSFTLLPEQMLDLKQEFEKIDTEGDGEISLKALKKVLLNSAEAGSLGALTEQEIDDIFDAIRVRKSEPTIRWHEFLAAGLSQARVDDRNLRIAFDRLDCDRKG
jgi:calcium-dependent protein kinase